MENGDKGNFQADIPDQIVADALRSVESRKESGDEATGEDIEIETESGTTADEGSEQTSEAAAGDSDLATRLAETEAKLQEKERQYAEAHERMLRLAADLDNLRKRTAREKEETVKYGNERLLKDLLPVVDNLERAVESGESQGLLEGVQLVLKQFVETLGKHEVRAFSAKGQAFDPNLHEALMQEEAADVPANTVVSELMKGYHLRDRLIRPAAVVVSKEPEGGSTAPAPGAEAESAESSDSAPPEGSENGKADG